MASAALLLAKLDLLLEVKKQHFKKVVLGHLIDLTAVRINCRGEESRVAGKAFIVAPPWEHKPCGRREVVGPEEFLGDGRERAWRQVQLILCPQQSVNN